MKSLLLPEKITTNLIKEKIRKKIIEPEVRKPIMSNKEQERRSSWHLQATFHYQSDLHLLKTCKY